MTTLVLEANSNDDSQESNDIRVELEHWFGRNVEFTSSIRDVVMISPPKPSELRGSETERVRNLPVNKFKMDELEISNGNFSFRVSLEFDKIELDGDRNEVTVYPPKAKVTDNLGSRLVDSHVKCYTFKLVGSI